MKRTPRSIPIVLAVGAVLLVGSLIFWLRPKSPAIERDARTILSEMEQGDGAGLYAHAYDHEKKQLGLTPEKVEAVYKRLILPRFAGFHPVGAMQSMVNRDASQAAAWQPMSDGHGHTFDLDATPWSSPDGGKQMVMARLMTAWIVEYRIKQNKSTDSLGCAEARLEGLAHDRKTLEEIGVPGMVADNPEQPMRPWDEYIRYWEGLTAKLRDEKNAKGGAPLTSQSSSS